MNADLRSFWLEFQAQCLDAINNLQKKDDYNRDWVMLFRGEVDHCPDRPVLSKLKRCYGPLRGLGELEQVQKRDLYWISLSLPEVDSQQFSQWDYAQTLDFRSDSARNLLFKLQHFGRPTMLVDFTLDVNVALFFASQSFEGDGCVKAFPFSEEDIWMPGETIPRATLQRSATVYVGANGLKPREDTYCWPVPAGLKQDLREHLKYAHGLSQLTLFPDLSGAIQSLNSEWGGKIPCVPQNLLKLPPESISGDGATTNCPLNNSLPT